MAIPDARLEISHARVFFTLMRVMHRQVQCIILMEELDCNYCNLLFCCVDKYLYFLEKLNMRGSFEINPRADAGQWSRTIIVLK
jgi:hypothetical protein